MGGGRRRVTEVDLRESAKSPAESARSRLGVRFRKFKHHKDLVVLAIGIVLSGVLTVLGVAHVNWPWLFGLGCGSPRYLPWQPVS
jgi:hypothetical protein